MKVVGGVAAALGLTILSAALATADRPAAQSPPRDFAIAPRALDLVLSATRPAPAPAATVTLVAAAGAETATDEILSVPAQPAADEKPLAPAQPAADEKPLAPARPAADDSAPTATDGTQPSIRAYRVPETPEKADARPPFEILGATVASGETRRLEWSGIESFAGGATTTPVLVAHGSSPGPTLCLSAAVHGDELNGIEIVRRVMTALDAESLSGTVVGVPIVNVYGFQRGSRYLPDRRDLNRYFPGDPRGSSASRIAHAFFEGVIRHCDQLVDIHTGSFHRTNLTQLRADVSNETVRELCASFGDMPILHNVGSPGTLRRATTDAGIPAVTIEAGEPMRLDGRVVERGVTGIENLLANRAMVKHSRLFGDPQPVFYRSTWVRADSGGILFSLVDLGETVEAGDGLGTVTDPITNVQAIVRSPYNGTVLGMALNQFVMPGFAVFRIGIETTGEEVSETGPDTTLGPEPPLEGEPPVLPPVLPPDEVDERPE